MQYDSTLRGQASAFYYHNPLRIKGVHIQNEKNSIQCRASQIYDSQMHINARHTAWLPKKEEAQNENIAF